MCFRTVATSDLCNWTYVFVNVNCSVQILKFNFTAGLLFVS